MHSILDISKEYNILKVTYILKQFSSKNFMNIIIHIAFTVNSINQQNKFLIKIKKLKKNPKYEISH